VIKTNRLSNGKPWITSGIRISRKRKRGLYTECRKYKNPTLDKYYKDCCWILSKVIKKGGGEYDRCILNSTNKMKTSWNLINIE